MNKRDTIIRSIYGNPGDESNLEFLNLPYRMKLSWDLNTTINRFKCHKKVVTPLKFIFDDILKHYGETRIKELGLDIFGGCYNFRNIRGGKNLSKHSWGIAVDLDPMNNQLRWDNTRASFAKPEYEHMIQTFYKYGFLNLGVEKNYDWMHFQVRMPTLFNLDPKEEKRV